MTNPICSRAISSHHVDDVRTGWQLAATAADSISFEQLNAAGLQWRDAIVPGTLASSLHPDLNEPGNYDRRDWWYRVTFAAPAGHGSQGVRHRLRFEGLATLADVWLNGHPLLSTRNMFCTDVVNVTGQLQEANTLVIRFRALETALELKRPRPRWKTALVQHQNLRWFRTTLLGRIPAWTPAIEPVGPWRPVQLETVATVDVTALDLQTRLDGTTGVVSVQAHIQSLQETPTTATLVVGEHRFVLDITRNGQAHDISGSCEIPHAPLWWPNTHGGQPLLPCRLELSIGTRIVTIDCGRIGFKSVQVNRSGGAVEFIINGVPVFCRGACWTVNDILSLAGSHESLRQKLQLARDANINMLRIGGTMIYEQDAFFRLCDELGILVWQDFMFANMDYPVADPDFHASIVRETRQQLDLLQKHVCVAAYCAGSEIEQQAAMMGLPASEWTNPFFAEELPQLCAQLHAGIPWFRNSPSEGALPFHVGTGISHYYGVGAYRRPLSDAKHAGVKFASECLGIANVPEPDTMALLLEGKLLAPHHPRWKARVARDAGSGYDFEDIRDFYLREIFQLDPIQLRSENPERYYAVSRAVSGEVMLRTFAEWRRASNPCAGGLIWFYQDLWPGAGWGIVDSENRPKAAWHYVRRAWAPRAILITDDGLDGIKLQLCNDSADAFEADIELGLLQHGKVKTLERRLTRTLAPRSVAEVSVDETVGHFTDCNYAYRFGPAGHDTIYCRLIASGSGQVVAEDVYMPLRKIAAMVEPHQIHTTVTALAEGGVELTLSADALLQDVTFTGTDYMPDVDHFHVVPGRHYRIRFRPAHAAAKKFKAYLGALNLWEAVTLRDR